MLNYVIVFNPINNTIKIYILTFHDPILTLLRPYSDPSPNFVRFPKICTFADDEIRHHPYWRFQLLIHFFNSMSKGNMLLGHARGKVGSLVFSRSNGQQIVRSRAEVVKNPQTTQQMIQRIILNTVAQAYSRMSAITDHSFEGIQTGQKSMSYFMRKNMDALRAKVANISVDSGLLGDVYAFTPIGQNVLAPNAYEIAKGTLPEVRAYMMDEDNTVAAMALNANTYEGVINQYGLQRGDQLTFVTMQQNPLTNIVSFHFARIILDPMNADGTEADISSPFISNGAVNLPNVRNEGSFQTFVYDTDHVEFGFTAGYLAATGIIVSRKEGSSWLRSNCTMVASEVSYGQAVSMGEALDLFQTGGIDTLNSRYLNNSGMGNVVSEGASANLPSFDAVFANGLRLSSSIRRDLGAIAANSNVVITGNVDSMEGLPEGAQLWVRVYGTSQDYDLAQSQVSEGGDFSFNVSTSGESAGVNRDRQIILMLIYNQGTDDETVEFIGSPMLYRYIMAS